MQNLIDKEKSLIEKKQKIAVQIEGLKHEMAAAEEYENNLKKLNNLEIKMKEFSLLAEEIVKADKAKGLREFIKLHEASENYLAESKKNLKDSEELLKKVQEDFKAIEKCSQEMNELNKKNEESGKNLKVLQEKLPSFGISGTVYLTEKGNLYLTKDDGSLMPLAGSENI